MRWMFSVSLAAAVLVASAVVHAAGAQGVPAPTCATPAKPCPTVATTHSDAGPAGPLPTGPPPGAGGPPNAAPPPPCCKK